MNISLLDLVSFFRPSIPGKWSIRCIWSKVEFPCGMVTFTTGLTGCVDRSRCSVFSIICIVCIGIVGNSIVRVRVFSNTKTKVVIVSTIRVSSGLFFLSFELMALASMVTWIIEVVAR